MPSKKAAKKKSVLPESATSEYIVVESQGDKPTYRKPDWAPLELWLLLPQLVKETIGTPEQA